ncbi:membrane protein [Deinococcus seoulensis]|uniref:Membrane protein n=2 Tax=Deinococcus TaxID=1298 RepID=A0ABQ2RM82_9DEIO|nr:MULTISPECIES: DedA family protein [Deinococcus]GGR46936.1 membrane protein [Deinococcus seoulensis]GGS15293.1 membrane protein [Deinococcus knuensis]
MHDLTALILSASYFGILAIVFAETGLLVGFFLPGDSLLLAAGVLAANGDLNLGGVMAAVIVGAFVGCVVGYWIGHRFGRGIFSQQNAKFFKPEYITRSELFFQRYGWLAVILARFVPVVRTLVPTMAGVSRMPLGLFNLYNIVGAVLWGVSVPALGYYLGGLIPNLDRYILIIVGGVVVVSVIPIIFKVVQARRA